MQQATVYFHPITNNSPQEVAKIARMVLERMIEDKKINTYFVDTVTVTGGRNTADKHKNVARKHGFTRIPFVIATDWQ